MKLIFAALQICYYFFILRKKISADFVQHFAFFLLYYKIKKFLQKLRNLVNLVCLFANNFDFYITSTNLIAYTLQCDFSNQLIGSLFASSIKK